MFNKVFFKVFTLSAAIKRLDASDVSQLLIFIRVISSRFEVYEELIELCSLHGTTKGSDIFNAVKNAIEPFGGFKKCHRL